MNKNGLLYIDWSISIGIFVIFVLALFILVVPSLDRRLDEGYLITIAETGLKGEAYYSMYNLPLFVDSEVIETGVKISVDLPHYPEVASYDSIVVTDKDYSEISSEISSSGLINFGPVDLITGVNQFNILYLIGESHSSDNPSGSSTINCGSFMDCTFGIEERLIGFSRNKLDGLFVDCITYEKYTEFKESLSYPSQKEISVSINVSESSVLYECTFKEPESLDSVYALSWKDKILNFNGSLEEVTVVLRTW
jgi:hypothetical protein